MRKCVYVGLRIRKHIVEVQMLDRCTSSTLFPLKLNWPSRMSCLRILTRSIELSQDFTQPAQGTG